MSLISRPEAPAEVRESRGRYIGLVYLFFLGSCAVEIAREDKPWWHQAAAAACLLLFIGLYIRFFCIKGVMRQVSGRMREARIVAAVLCGLSLVLPLIFGDVFVGLIVYASVVAVVAAPANRWVVTIFGMAAANAVMMLIVGVSTDEFLTMTMIAFLSPFTVAGMRKLIQTNVALREAKEENARLAVSEERLRFARDLHDLLGHSLSLIALKSQLAGRLLERDPEQVAAELRDIESVARQALVEVRETVSGYRRSLTEELAGAASALRAADIEVQLPKPGEPLPATVESLLGWAVREGTTNILRHSDAGRVVLAIERCDDQVRLGVRDDGTGPPDRESDHIDVGGGHGLRGLSERMAAAGGTMQAGPVPGGGFELTVTVPLDANAYAVAPRPQETAPDRNDPAEPATAR
ncbi:MAG TPA: sensor histidine kinase [Mycobacteriales bacterium]|nr:sensor histidine kinase [Mycobacteriales bacterium]